MITPEEQKSIQEKLKKEGLEEFFENIIKSYDPISTMNKLIEKKTTIKNIIEKYENGNNKVAFEKANNSDVYINIENIEAIAEIQEPLEMSFEEFVQKFKPKMIWHKNGRATYSALLGKYRYFAKDYKVVVIRIRFTDRDMIRIATKLSKNIYPLSKYLNELMPIGFVLFIP
ncbi:MAG: hypothetical protein RXR43_16760 [Sulfolobus sp.]